MKALVRNKPGSTSLEPAEMDTPVAGRTDLLLEPVLVGICHTDLGMLNGDFDSSADGYSPDYPLVMGHEFVGRIVEVGSDVAGFVPGQRVVGSAHVTCRECRWCLSGRSMLCEKRHIVGLDRNGAFADRFVLPAVCAVVVPDSVEDDVAVLAEPLAVAMHAVERAQLRSDDRIAVIGPGAVGLLTVAALAGYHVTAVGLRTDGNHLELARQLGAAETRYVDEIGADDIFDVVFEAAGHRSAVELGVGHLGRGGRLVCVGLPADSAGVRTADLAWGEQQITGSRAYDLSTWARVPAMLEANPRLSTLITHRLPMSDVEAAFGLIRRHEAIKIALRP